jgi:putative addiction module component (TIGR02574 family)
MHGKISMNDVRQLSVAERILLVEDIWDSILDDAQAVGPTESQRSELDKRLAAFESSPDAGSDWETIRARLRGT